MCTHCKCTFFNKRHRHTSTFYLSVGIAYPIYPSGRDKSTPSNKRLQRHTSTPANKLFIPPSRLSIRSLLLDESHPRLSAGVNEHTQSHGQKSILSEETSQNDRHEHETIISWTEDLATSDKALPLTEDLWNWGWDWDKHPGKRVLDKTFKPLSTIIEFTFESRTGRRVAESIKTAALQQISSELIQSSCL